MRPVEIARKLAREMDEHKTVSVSRTYVPNEYVVWLSPEDRERFEGVEDEVIDELAAYLLEHARRERLALVSRPQIEFHTDERLRARRVRHPGAARPRPRRARTTRRARATTATRWSTRPRPAPRRSSHEARSARARPRVLRGRGQALRRSAPGGAVIGRSRECDIVLDDSNVSRRHAEIRPLGRRLDVTDLGSTNGVRVNGRDVAPTSPQSLQPGDRDRARHRRRDASSSSDAAVRSSRSPSR